MGRKSSKTLFRVFFEQNLIGILERSSSGEVSFHYAKEWLNSEQAFPISYSLRLTDERYKGEVVSAYFDNLLPDSDNIRKAIARRTGAASASSIDLLAALGRDCVGALRFYLGDQDSSLSDVMQSRILSENEIATILRNLDNTPLGVGKGSEFRISIAGAQDKTALLKQKDYCVYH